jgi:hypothetical protein
VCCGRRFRLALLYVCCVLARATDLSTMAVISSSAVNFRNVAYNMFFKRTSTTLAFVLGNARATITENACGIACDYCCVNISIHTRGCDIGFLLYMGCKCVCKSIRRGGGMQMSLQEHPSHACRPHASIYVATRQHLCQHLCLECT